MSGKLDHLKSAEDKSGEQSKRAQRRNQQRSSASATQARQLAMTSVQTVNGTEYIRTSFKYGHKKWILRGMLALPIFCIWALYMLSEAGELGYNTILVFMAVAFCQLGSYIGVAMTDAEDIWNQIRHERDPDDDY